MPKKFKKTKPKWTKRPSLKKKTQITSLSYNPSRFNHQPVPDRYFVWLELENYGYTAAVTASDLFYIRLNALVNPMNTGTPFPNAKVATNALNPAGFKDIIFNATQGTGLYLNYRVWSVIVAITTIPLSTADAVIVAMAPVPTGNSYGSVSSMGQGPDNVVKTCTANTSASACTLRKKYSLPALYGISPKDFGTLATNNYGTYSTSPGQTWDVQFRQENLGLAVSTAKVCYQVRIKYHIEFFQRTDTVLIDT